MKNLEENRFVELISKIPNVAVQGYDKERVVIYWNEASEKIYGFSKDEALGKKLEDLIIPDFMVNDVIAFHKNWIDNNVPIPAGKLPLKHKNGSIVHVYSSHIMLAQNTQNPEMFCVDVDLTEQVKKENELKIKDKLLEQKSKMASMGEMLDNIAHQWRQPLSMISCAAVGIQLENDLKKLNDEYLNKSINSIVDTTKYLSQTIDDFRDFIKGTHQKVCFDLLENMNYSLKLLDAQIKKNNLNIILSSPYGKCQICSYPNELVQVIINIISNSKDAFKERKIKNRYVFIDIKKHNEKFIISIKDNAGGISENVINRVFKQDFTTKSDDKGSGVGLYMSEKLVKESMNGTIEAKNVEFPYEDKFCKGVEFKISLPINR